VRAQVLQSHAVEVRLAEDLSGARFLWQPNMYDMILLAVRRHLPGEALEFYEQIRARKPKRTLRLLGRDRTDLLYQAEC
jgi:hypothetical protein